MGASIGAPRGFSESAWAAIGPRLVDVGVVVAVAAGNSGNSGPFYTDSGAIGENVLAVGAIEPLHKPGNIHLAASLEDGRQVLTPMMTRSGRGSVSGVSSYPV